MRARICAVCATMLSSSSADATAGGHAVVEARGRFSAGRALPPLALSGGEPAGIGPDITLAVWAGQRAEPVPHFAVFGDADTWLARSRQLGLDVPVVRVGSLVEAAARFAHALPVVDVPHACVSFAGQPDERNGSAVIASIVAATAAVARGEASALVTNPIAKSVLYAAGFGHPGHTEFLAELAGTHFPGRTFTSVMMLAAAELRVVPLTIHVALSYVPGLITRARIVETGRIMHVALRSDFGCAKPRIAVAGLNPHAGESGTMGTEDRDIIAPAIADLRAEGLDVTGPHSADTLFHAEARTRYDAVLAMYHDQALIPIKTLAFDRGVNVTLGLPFVRTSPDHGTAFDIAGTGRASPTSLREALRVAHAMALSRRAAAAPAG
jgi:4-hydroxythreonine-4-phosphate dehydrogenase